MLWINRSPNQLHTQHQLSDSWQVLSAREPGSSKAAPLNTCLCFKFPQYLFHRWDSHPHPPHDHEGETTYIPKLVFPSKSKALFLYSSRISLLVAESGQIFVLKYKLPQLKMSLMTSDWELWGPGYRTYILWGPDYLLGEYQIRTTGENNNKVNPISPSCDAGTVYEFQPVPCHLLCLVCLGNSETNQIDLLCLCLRKLS